MLNDAFDVLGGSSPFHAPTRMLLCSSAAWLHSLMVQRISKWQPQACYDFV